VIAVDVRVDDELDRLRREPLDRRSKTPSGPKSTPIVPPWPSSV
jgi:hypothetical protein